MIRRLVLRALDAQTAWADPLGSAIQSLLGAVFGRLRFVKDLLNGTWLGHSIHALLTDVPIGAFTLAIVFDVLGFAAAADIAITVGIVTMLAAALAGWADYADADGKAKPYGTVHQVLMLTALALYALSLWIREASWTDRGVAVWLSVAGYVVLAVGAYIGGELVYGLGNMVDRHAFRSFSAKWQPLELPGADENTPLKAKAGAQTLVVVRRGDRIFALHDVCAHQGCSLSEGKLVDDAIECGCHGSLFELDTGHVLRGPSTFDQPRFEARRTEDGKLEARRASR